MVCPNSLERLEAAHAGHGDVHDQYIRGQIIVALAGAFARLGFSDDLDFRMRLQEQPETGANDGVVVYQHDADHALTVVAVEVPASGISAVRQTPCGSRLRTSRRPPRCSTRSVKPTKPK